jgi:Ca2+-binding RTX toxin-like protein
MNSELFKAILAMDSYNRGYGAGIDTTNGNGLGGIGSTIGNATIITDSSKLSADGAPRLDIPAGFYAVAYTLASGEKVISYRGTNADSILNFAIDAFYGYGIGAGANSATQGNLAIEFYKAVRDVAPSATITLTGHSLGGGLAGYIGGLYGKYVSIFDNMTYENSVNGAFAVASNPVAYATLTDPETGEPYIDSDRLAFAQSLRNNIYGGATPWNPVFTGNAWYVEGELLDNLLPARDSQYLSPIFINSYGGTRSSIDLHDMALLVTLRYAELNYGITIADWHAVGSSFINSLFNDTLAIAAGYESLGGVFGDAQKMRNAIAYSAIDEGERPFGDTAIRAMFGDANELGKVFGATGKSSIIQNYAGSISNILVQFAGKLAIDDVEMSTSPTAVNGVLELSTDGEHLDINFGNPLWAATSDIVGRTTLFNNIFAGSFSADANINAAMQNLWGNNSTTIFDHVILATKNTGGTINLLNAPAANKANLFVGSLGVDIVTGSSGNDALLGYDGNDSLGGGAGSDILVGGNGNDVLYGGSGSDIVYGGAGDDTIIASGGGNDIIDGGSDVDTISYIAAIVGVDVNLGNETAVYNGSVSTLYSIENVIGSSSDDDIIGNAWNNTLNGGGGIDTLEGGGGVDTLLGGAEDDILIGGANNDIFVIDGGMDTITDGEDGDRVQFGNVTVTGTATVDGSGMYQLNGYILQQQGVDLVVTSSGYGSGATIKDFFNQIGNAYDPAQSYSFMGITIPAPIPALDTGSRATCSVAANDNRVDLGFIQINVA